MCHSESRQRVIGKFVGPVHRFDGAPGCFLFKEIDDFVGSLSGDEFGQIWYFEQFCV